MTVTDRLAGLSEEKRKLLEMRLRMAREAAAAVPELVPRARPEGTAPLSFAQQRMWLLDRMDPGTAAWNIPSPVRLTGPLDVPALERALNALRERHESLRTTFAEREGGAVQVIHPYAPVSLPFTDLSALPQGERDDAVERLAKEDANTGFDLEAGPLHRNHLLRLKDDQHVLLACTHHAITDGWSMGVVQRELAELYHAFARGEPNPLKPPALQYADFAAWQREWLSGERLDRAMAYWRRALEGAPPALELPTDRPRPASQSHRGAREVVELDRAAAERLRALAAQENATLFAALVAAFRVVLARWSGQGDVVIGTPTAGRSRVETEALVGYFVNTLALRTPIVGDPSFRELLRRERDTTLDAFAHQELPFERIVEELKVPRDPARHPVFQAMLSLQNAVSEELALSGLQIDPVNAGYEASKFDLAVEVHEVDDAGLYLVGDYAVDLFDGATVGRMLTHLRRVLEQASAAPDRRVSRIALLDAGERAEAVFEHNDTAREWPFVPVHRAVVAQAERTPDAVAVDVGGTATSYAALNARADAVAAELASRGVGRGSLVAVFLDRTVDLPAALLGVLKSGAAYVPVDPSYPEERIRWMLEDSAAAVVLTTRELADLLPATGASVVPMDEIDATKPAPSVEVDGEDLAYVIYTSGSTGRPKGAAIPHRALANHMRWMQDAFPLEGGDRVLQKTPVSFDASVWEFWAPLMAGATLVMGGPDAHRDPAVLARETAERGITTLQLVPTLLRAVMDEPAFARAASLRRLFAGGEALPAELVRRAVETHPSLAVVNLYGPSETCIDATCHVASGGDGTGVVPLGAPVSNLRAYVLDARLEPVPAGIPGELWLAGTGLGRGYHARPALTAERWLPEPFSGDEGARMYRTGDRARRRKDGAIEYLGRADEQVKVRGVRVELGEVEAALAALPGVREAAAALRGEDGRKRLVGYVVPSGGALSPEALREALRGRLPDAIVPTAFVQLAALPRTPGGKLDRRALPTPELRTDGDAFAAPSSPDEELLAAVWAEVLGVDRVGATDDFFELGGHSLLATQAVARVRQLFGVELPLRAVFESPTLRAQARRIAELRAAGEGAPAGPIPRADRSAPLPLSFAQERLWFIDQLEPGSSAYNVPLALDLLGRVDAAALQRALGEVVRRHEALRTVFATAGDEPVQVIQPFAGFHLPVVDLTDFASARRHEEAERIVDAEARAPFNLAAGPLIRATLIRVAEDEHTLVLVMHHVVSDAWSTGILFAELTALYAAYASGDDPHLADLPVQYADFAAWQRAWLQGEALERQTAYWKRRLAGAPAVLELPTDRPRPAVQDLSGALLPFALPPETAAAARGLARREGATLFMVLLAAFDAVLHRWSGEEDVVVGTPIANRTRPELEGLIGFFDNTLALRADLSGDPTFAQLLRRVRETTLEAYAHQDVPFEKLVDELKAERSLSHTPLFQVMLTLQNTPTGGGLELGGAELRGRAAETGTSRFDLTLILTESPDGALAGYAEYATALFDAETVARLAEHLDAILREAAARPDAPLSTLSVLSPEERETVLRAFNATDRPAVGSTVHALVSAQARRTPDALAVEHLLQRVTYAELEARANRLAHHLLRLGVRPDARVAVSMERSVEMVVAVLAVLKAGAGYVAVDPGYPADRVAYMLEDSRASVVLTTSLVAKVLPETDAAVVRVDADRDAIAAESSDDPGVAVDPETLLYVLYTSGSTGKPKGAALPHRALANLLRWQVDRWAGDAAARTLQFASLSFDVSFQEIFSTWAAGGTLVLVDDDTRRDGEALLSYLRRFEVQRLFLPFAALQNLAETAEIADTRLPSLRQVITAGEALRSTPQLRAFFRANPAAALENQYGPSETHVISAQAVDGEPDAWSALPPIGAPVDSTQLYVLDARMGPAPIGVPGELYAGGANLARGYLGRPSLTAQKFVPDPFGPAGARLYRTGDRVRWRTDGALEYLGRTDFQVKVRGFRVEPGEIEAALTEHASVVQAAVVVRGEGAGKRLAAYVVAAAGAEPTAADLRAYLGGRLPEYMVPSAWTFMDALPLTPSGKVDRRSLPEPAAHAPGEAHVAPRTPAERIVADAWEAVLGVRPGAHDNFFDLGGHSLRATQVMARIRRAFGIELPLRALFESPTVAGLAERAANARRGDEVHLPPLVPAERGRTARLSFAQQRFWFVERMGAAGAAYNMPMAMRLRGPLDLDALQAAVDGLAERHESLRTTFHFAGDEPLQEVGPAVSHPIPVTDLRGYADDERAAEARRLADADSRTPFDLAVGPPVRWTLIRLGDEDWYLLVNLHHIVADGWSLGILFRELGALYGAACEGRAPELKPLPIQYPDYAVWQRERLNGAALEQELEWWRSRLEGAPTLALPTDRPHPPVQSFRGGTVGFSLPAEIALRVDELAREEGATPFMVFLAAFSTLLARWSAGDDVVVGSPVAGRFPEETEGLIGVFVNTLALRTDLSGDPTFRQALVRVREATVDAYAHQEVPFERLVEVLKVERSLSAHPLFQVVFSMHAEGSGAPSMPGLDVEVGEGDTSTTKVDLMLALTSGEAGVHGAWQYATDLWDEETIGRLARHFAVLMEGIVADPDRRLSTLPLMDADETDEVMAWSHGPHPAAGPALVHDLVRAQVERTPDHAALVDGDRVITYREMERITSRLARKLARLGVRPESRVAVCFDRSPELVLSQYAAMKAGAAYVPIDPAYPPDRIEHLLRDSAAPVLVTTAALAETLGDVSGTIVCLDQAWDDGPAEDDAPLELPLDPSNAVYVIYTSGSTGTPKGVVVPHGGVANLCYWRNGEYAVGPEDRTPLFTGVGFDASASEIWPALAAGASLHAVPAEVRTQPAALRDWLVKEEMTVSFIATPIAEALLPLQWPEGTRLRFVLTGGDALKVRPRPGLPFILANGYGPTENSVISTSCDVLPDAPGAPDIGRPLPGQQSYVLDSGLAPLPMGVVGELYLGGAGLARGYLNRPALTAEKFVPDPFSSVPGARLYRTGDRVRWRADGRIDFLGRADNQVKVRGHRIEPGEIETVLMRHPGVRQAVVAVRGEGDGKRLVAWVASASGHLPAAELRGWLRSRLPEYMVPATFVAVDALPYTANGKIDRGRLPEPAPERPVDTAPRSTMERTVVRVWEEVLGTTGVGLDDNFFEIGGHSLLMARMQERLREVTGRAVTVIELFQFSTARALAAHLDEAQDGEDAKPDTTAAATGQDRAALRREMMRRGRR